VTVEQGEVMEIIDQVWQEVCAHITAFHLRNIVGSKVETALSPTDLHSLFQTLSSVPVMSYHIPERQDEKAGSVFLYSRFPSSSDRHLRRHADAAPIPRNTERLSPSLPEIPAPDLDLSLDFDLDSIIGSADKTANPE
jgi:hypothetical protein